MNTSKKAVPSQNDFFRINSQKFENVTQTSDELVGKVIYGRTKEGQLVKVLVNFQRTGALYEVVDAAGTVYRGNIINYFFMEHGSRNMKIITCGLGKFTYREEEPGSGRLG